MVIIQIVEIKIKHLNSMFNINHAMADAYTIPTWHDGKHLF